MSDIDAPAAIRKRSKARKTRARALSPTDTAASDEAEASSSTLAAKLKKQHKAKSRLSFGGDYEEGDGEVFQVKKSSLSRRLGSSSRTSSLALPSNLDQASITTQSSSVVYSKEYLTELKANTRSAPSAFPPANTNDSDMVFDASEVAGAVIIDQEMSTENVSEIPSESSILAAKQKRDRLRQTIPPTEEGEDDFISLSVTRKEDTYQGPHPESRLMREDDELGEGDDEFADYTAAQERIALGRKAKKKEAVNRRSNMQELINDAEEDDEETIEWEREQLRRGSRQEAKILDAKSKKEYCPAPIPPPTPLPSLDTAISRLSQSLTQLTISHASSTSSASNLGEERCILESRETEMRTMVEKAEMKRSWFNSFREWVETVATFLDEKFPLLENLEEEHISFLKERSDMISKRRTKDDEDDLAMFLGSASNFAVARKERRAYRSLRHAQRAFSDEEEGYSTDSSLAPSDKIDYQTALTNLEARASDILQDVQSDEFRDPSVGVARWFGGWREKYSDTYTGAFGGLGMISAWEFWVRLEMLGWDPAADPRTLDSFAWFGALYDYSRPPVHDNDNMEDDEEPQIGPDGDLVSAMISTAVVPRLCKIIRSGAFDPYSAKHIRILIDLAEQVEASASRDKLDLLFRSVVASFRQTVENAITTSHSYLERHYPTKFDPEAIPARRRFLMRMYKLVSNLARWKKYSAEKSGVDELIDKLMADCIRPAAETGWDVGGEDMMQKVAKVIPSELR